MKHAKQWERMWADMKEKESCVESRDVGYYLHFAITRLHQFNKRNWHCPWVTCSHPPPIWALCLNFSTRWSPGLASSLFPSLSLHLFLVPSFVCVRCDLAVPGHKVTKSPSARRCPCLHKTRPPLNLSLQPHTTRLDRRHRQNLLVQTAFIQLHMHQAAKYLLSFLLLAS